jgi:hypothetical protein
VSTLEAEGEGSLAGCLDAAQDRSLPPQQERHLSMLHTIKPFYDNNKKGEKHLMTCHLMAPPQPYQKQLTAQQAMLGDGMYMLICTDLSV